MNEGACDPDGRFYGGSMGHDHQRGARALYRLDPDCSARMVLDHVTIFNGLGLEPGWRSRLLHRHRDAPRRRVRLRAGHGADRAAPFIEIPADVGRPGGLTVDAEGGVWIAVNRAGAVRRYTAADVLDQVFEVPARKVTARTFGGARLDELFITTSREDLEPGDDPLTGSLFGVVAGVRGQPVREFAG